MTDSENTCEYCEAPVSPTAKKCRHCGEWFSNPPMRLETIAKPTTKHDSKFEFRTKFILQIALAALAGYWASERTNSELDSQAVATSLEILQAPSNQSGLSPFRSAALEMLEATDLISTDTLSGLRRWSTEDPATRLQAIAREICDGPLDDASAIEITSILVSELKFPPEMSAQVREQIQFLSQIVHNRDAERETATRFVAEQFLTRHWALQAQPDAPFGTVDLRESIDAYNFLVGARTELTKGSAYREESYGEHRIDEHRIDEDVIVELDKVLLDLIKRVVRGHHRPSPWEGLGGYDWRTFQEYVLLFGAQSEFCWVEQGHWVLHLPSRSIPEYPLDLSRWVVSASISDNHRYDIDEILVNQWFRDTPKDRPVPPVVMPLEVAPRQLREIAEEAIAKLEADARRRSLTPPPESPVAPPPPSIETPSNDPDISPVPDEGR